MSGHQLARKPSTSCSSCQASTPKLYDGMEGASLQHVVEDLTDLVASKPLVLVDSEGMIIGVMVGKSTDKAYIANAEAVVGILREAREEAEIPMSDCDHRRGEYAQLHRGVGGQGVSTPKV